MADKKLRPSSQADLRHKLRKNLGINQSFYVVFRFTDEWVGITVGVHEKTWAMGSR